MAVDVTGETTVLATMGELIVEIIGEQYVLDLTIGPQTSFNVDLELESIEFVALAAALREHYGERVDFVAFLAERDVEEIIALTVGEVVEYIEASLATDTEPSLATNTEASLANDRPAQNARASVDG